MAPLLRMSAVRDLAEGRRQCDLDPARELRVAGVGGMDVRGGLLGLKIPPGHMLVSAQITGMSVASLAPV